MAVSQLVCTLLLGVAQHAVNVRGTSTCPTPQEIAERIPPLLSDEASFPADSWIEVREEVVAHTGLRQAHLSLGHKTDKAITPMGTLRLVGTCDDAASEIAVFAATWSARYETPAATELRLPTLGALAQDDDDASATPPGPASVPSSPSPPEPTANPEVSPAEASPARHLDSPSATATARAEPAATASRPMSIGVSGGAIRGLDSNTAPRLGVVVSAPLFLTNEAWLGRLSAWWDAPRTVSFRTVNASGSWLRLGVSPGVARRWERGQLFFEAGGDLILAYLRVDGSGFETNFSYGRIDVALAPSGRVGWRSLDGDWNYWLGVGTSVWLSRRQLSASGTDETRQLPSVDALASLGCDFWLGR